jgi:hypothetical protein
MVDYVTLVKVWVKRKENVFLGFFLFEKIKINQYSFFFRYIKSTNHLILTSFFLYDVLFICVVFIQSSLLLLMSKKEKEIFFFF